MPKSRQVVGEQTSQYHHFIPRFILQNFSHPFRPSKSKSKEGNGPKRGFRRGEPMLYTIDLLGNGDVVEAPIAKSFGLTDMYRDIRDAGNQHHLEQKLSVLESQASEIISKIRKSHDAGEPDVWMKRKQRDSLRKFLFIMKYRATGFHKRFQHETAQEYSADDKERFVKYMAEKGFTRPMDVWFDNIKAILDLKMDPGMKWGKELMGKMYPDDAKWAFAHIQAMYLTICTPSDKDDEFLLSENLFSIHEGPTSLIIDEKTGKLTEGAYTEWHVFAAISPKLIMVLRSNLLPNPEEDSNEENKRHRELLYNESLNQHSDPSTAHSGLEDLPVRKANNSYTKFVDGKRVPVQGEDGTPRAGHRFGFPFFPIETDHVNKINCCILQESDHIITLAFYSKAAALKTLEWYLPLLAEATQFNRPDDRKVIYLKKLEHAADSLSPTKEASMANMNRILRQERSEVTDLVDKNMRRAVESDTAGPGAPYLALGGTGRTILYDLEQARRMRTLRIKIDVWSQGLDESIRHQARENVRDLFCQLPPRRVYLYMKCIREMELGSPCDLSDLNRPERSLQDMFKLIEGPEDVIAKDSPLAAQVFQPDRLSTLLYYTTMNACKMAQNPNFSVDKEITMDERGGRHVQLMRMIVFGQAGSICDCGNSPPLPQDFPPSNTSPFSLIHSFPLTAIPSLSSHARHLNHLITSTPIFDPFRHPLMPKEENNEMGTRVLLKHDFMGIMMENDGKLPRKDLEELEKVLFGVVYPTWGSG